MSPSFPPWLSSTTARGSLLICSHVLSFLRPKPCKDTPPPLRTVSQPAKVFPWPPGSCTVPPHVPRPRLLPAPLPQAPCQPLRPSGYFPGPRECFHPRAFAFARLSTSNVSSPNIFIFMSLLSAAFSVKALTSLNLAHSWRLPVPLTLLYFSHHLGLSKKLHT